MDFARKQLEKYGWTEGKGLGKRENGISAPLKPKLKFDNSGVGHDAGEQFTNNWWEKLFNSAAENIDVEVDGKNEVKMKIKTEDSVEISTKNYSMRDLKKNKRLEYGSFLKTAKLKGNTMEQYDTPNLPEPTKVFHSLTDDELFAACGGRTAHKGARHGLKLNGKLSRIEKQEKMLLKKMKKVSLSDNNSCDESITEKKFKKLKKQKDRREKYTPIVEDSMESTSSNGMKKKKKRKSVSFNETVTVTPIFTVDLDTSFESELGSVKDENSNESNLENIASGSDEGIEQDIENNNNEHEQDNHKSFEVGQFNINDLSKAERKKLKKKRKLEAKKNTATEIFLQKLSDDMDEDGNMIDFEEKDKNLKKRKFFEDSENVDYKNAFSKTESPIGLSRAKMTPFRASAIAALKLTTVVLVIDGVLQGAFAKWRPRYEYEQYDALFVARCEIGCWGMSRKNLCMKTCLAKGASKPGFCPTINATLSSFDKGCSDTCQIDTNCSGVEKCCPQSCGVACQSPVNLDSVQGIPFIPLVPIVIEGRRKRTIHIDWSTEESSRRHQEGGGIAGKVLYLIESRNHAGKYFIESQMSKWTLCSKAMKPRRVLKNFVSPGKWYQFRVAAVNANGTRGFSKSTLPFTVSTNPKPPRALGNITIGALTRTDGSLGVVLRWFPPPSDLPIQKYKVFWSRRLYGPAKGLDSVLVHQEVIPGNQTYFKLQNLEPHSQYFLQIQGLARFGKNILKGEKSGDILNTTINENDNALILDTTGKEKIEKLQLHKLTWNRGKLTARISWKPLNISSRYIVTWWRNPCHRRGVKGQKHYKMSEVTKGNFFDLYDLQFDCRYRVSVKKVNSSSRKRRVKSTQNTYVTFTTPKCSIFKKSQNKIKCN